ncbi:MAG TPA: PAS domain S-box protein [Candidatus Sulfomarinibacteraceae bacterium]|nr:PAS domain S-box protein [Candidatus Sulfomarinibacteraceae bacterium]
MLEPDQKRTESDLRFLAEASTLLATSQDVEATLQQIAALAVPRIADWCVIYGLTESGDVERRAVEVRGGNRRELAHRLQTYPLGEHDPVRIALRTGEPQLIREVTDDDLRAGAVSEEHLSMMRELNLRSLMAVPMYARHRPVGAIAFSISDSSRRYSERDLLLAADLARSAGIAFDNARLYDEQKRTEQALRESVARSQRQLSELQAIYATAPVGLCFVDPSCRYVSVNKAMARMNNLPADEHVGRRFADVLPEVVAYELEATCLEVMETGEPVFNQELSRPASEPGGDGQHWLGSFYPVYGGDDAPFGINMVLQDITGRKQRELDQQFLSDLDGRLRQLTDPEAIVWEVVSNVGVYLDLSFCSFADVDVEADRITLHEDWSRDGQSVAGRYLLSEYLPSDFITDAQAGRTITLGDTAEDGRTEALYAGRRIPLGVRAIFMVPYFRDEEWVALLIAAADRPRAWRGREGRLMEAAATRVWTAVERARAEQASRLAAEQRQLALESAQMGAWGLDDSNQEMYWDDRSRAIFGMSPEDEASFEALMDRIHPVDRGRVAQAVERARAGEDSGRFAEEYRVMWPDGSLRWVVGRGQVYFEGEGGERRPTHFTGVLIDVTERKSAEEALRDSERRFRATFEQAAVGMSHLSLDGTWLRVNRRLCEIVGCTRQELLAMTFQDITHPDDLEEDLQNLRRLLDGEIRSYQMEKRYFHKNGDVVWVLLTVSLVRDAETNEPEYLIGVVEDISDRKRYESELKALNETLEQRVQERTRQVRVLASELTLAEQRERRRIAHVLHDDIQQMLYSLQINIQLLGQGQATEGPATIESQLQEMRALIGQIIDANRRLTVELSPPVLKAERLDEAFEWLIAHLEEDYGLEVQLSVDGDCHVPDDDLRELIFQLVRELLLNVVRHAGVSQARLYLSEEEDMLVTRVEDDGVGFNVEAVMAAQDGFGLFSVQERLDLFGGRMEITSGPGQGTRITVSVPLRATTSAGSL